MSLSISKRLLLTERPYIEDILDHYMNMNINNITNMALGSSYWIPPKEAIEEINNDIYKQDIHRYGNIMGLPILKEKLKKRLNNSGLDMNNMDIVITMGANQAFTNIALSLLDNNDNVILITPYYFSHKLSLQLVGANVHMCPFNETTLYPNFTAYPPIATKDQDFPPPGLPNIRPKSPFPSPPWSKLLTSSQGVGITALEFSL